MQTLEECQLTLLTIFPGICQEHVSKIYQQVSQNSDQLISYVLDRIEKGMPYPKTKKEDQNLKRKRVVSQDEEAALIYGAEDRPPPSLFGEILVTIRNILSNEFPNVPMQFIDNRLAQNQHRLFHTYSQLDEITREYNPNNKPFQKLKKPRPSKGYISVRVQEFLDNPTNVARNPDTAEAYRELQVCRKHSAKAEAARAAERQHLVEETENERRAQADGTMSECGCCFSDFPINRMIHCNAETFHLFCKACARQTAETEIGNSKYEIRCMSMDGCSGGFDNDQRSQFLDGKTIIALERNEQEAMLRMAGIENLASCPFCPFAAEYPPAGVDKEFRCQAPDCERVSCRLCNNESHIPKSCAEFGKEQGLSARRQIEEAMSAAMIRKCNRCATPFIKEQGCNKMTCTRYGCLNIQCYVCSKSCGYDHFDDKTRGGKNGNCPLFENADDRHKLEVSIAEQEALAKVRAEHPEYSEEDLKIRVSESVLEDEKQRKARKPAVMAHANRLNAHIANDG
ncbi:ring finger protein [Amylocarpus encephaloides]|uniref:Ring finger protein n=1 Tax=Amylocarpus encephaloides TaxID=45428 RepID=A0A9P8C2D2_9HELO|nr:ring finger protein [Amylocarpus encephaloides]